MSTDCRIYRSLEEIPDDFGPSALTIGNFDGVHAGHRRIMRRVAAVAAERGLKPSALTFHPHPTRIVAPARAPRLMTTPEQRVEIMGREGIRQVVILPFNEEFSRISPEGFVEEILVRRLKVQAVLVGGNFRFGYRHAGDIRLLAQLGGRFGFTTEIVPAVRFRGEMVSSSAARSLIAAGQVSRAARALERPYAIEGRVVPGHGIGSRQTVPTLNLSTNAELLPATGVYVTQTYDLDSDREWDSITNVGYRPTFGGTDLSIETFLLTWLTGEAPARIRLEFLHRVRAERKFATPAELKAQILSDVRRAQAFFRRVSKWVSGRSPARAVS
jgi:riboflavin kinase / FMN adenylyltransferase